MSKKTNIILSGFLLIFGTPAFSQNQASLQGSVVSETGEKIEFYTLVLQSAVDSSVVAVEMFSETVFRFSGIKPQTYILRIQDVQYQQYDTLITVVEGTNELKTPLTLKLKILGEVVVKSSRPVLSYSHGNITVDVANSYLKDDVSLESVLGKLPGVIVDGEGKIGIFGKGNPRIYINGVPRSQDDLKSLQPLDIDKIEIIRNVGVEYESNVGAVIRIKTKKRRDEKYHVSITDMFQLNSTYLNNRPNVHLYLGNNEKFTQDISLINDFIKSKNRSTSSSYTYFDDYTNSQLRDNHSRGKRTGPWLTYFMNYSINNDTDLGVQCSGSLYNNWRQVNGNWDYNDKTGELNRDTETKTVLSNISLNYRQKINNTGELSVIADYAIRNTDITTEVEESAADWKLNNITDADNKGNAFSITPEYKTTWKKYTYSTGLKYILLNSKSATEFRPSTNVVHTKLSEYAAGVYMVFDANLSFVDIKSGIRMEYTNSDIRSDDELNNLSRDYFNWIPYISLNGKPNEHISLSAYYRQRLNRPDISILNSTVNYVDSLSYTTGNPRLKPSVADVFGFSAGIYKFDFSLDYSIYRDNIVSERIPDSENPNILIDTYVNTKEKNSALTVSISYSFNNPVFTNMTSLNYRKQFNVNMPFRNEIIRFNKPTYYFATSGNVKIFKNTNLNYNYSYNNGGDSNYTRTNTLRNRLDLAAVQFFMNRRLMISFAVSDVFNNKEYNTTAYYTGNTVVTNDSSYFNSRYVTFSLRYNWGVNKSIQQKSSNSEIGRL